jgi:hypothetical protein
MEASSNARATARRESLRQLWHRQEAAGSPSHRTQGCWSEVRPRELANALLRLSRRQAPGGGVNAIHETCPPRPSIRRNTGSLESRARDFRRVTVPSYSWGIANLRGPDPGSPPTEAHCTNCDQWKPLDAFRPNRRLRSGLHSWCRVCQLEATQDWRDRNRKEINRARREAYGATTPHKYPANRASPRPAA